MTREQILAVLPNASESFIFRNCDRSERIHSSDPERAERNTLELKPSTDIAALNKTEQAYLAHIKSQEHDWIGVQNITLKLAHDCRLTCDFVVFNNGAMRFIDVKGFQREDALIKMKVAARLFPWAQFQIVKRNAATWNVINVKP